MPGRPHLECAVLPADQLYWHHHAWTHWDLNPGPSACEADVMPLHHVPLGEWLELKSLAMYRKSGAGKVDMQRGLELAIGGKEKNG